MAKVLFQLPKAASLLCPMAHIAQQLIANACGRIPADEFFPEDQFICSKKKTADFYETSTDTLDLWIEEGRLKPIKRGRCFFFPINDLVESVLNDPKISSFVAKKAVETQSGKKRKKPVRQQKFECSAILRPGKDYMFLLIRFQGVKLACNCAASLLQDEKALQSFVDDMITYYNYCQTLKSSTYERN